MTNNEASRDLFDTWISTGVLHGFISASFCAAHEQGPLSAVELDYAALDDIDLHDVCTTSVRIFPPSS